MKYHFHPLGEDNDGNFGPSSTTPGWIEIEAATYTEASAKLPETEVKKIQVAVNKSMALDSRDWEEEKKSYQNRGLTWDPVEVFIGLTAGMGNDFTLMDEETFEQLQYNETLM